jgi:uncharacterized protein (UPF0332 family)
MKRIDFLVKLQNEGKLELVEPSELITESYMVKSESYMGSAKLLFENNRLEESVSMAYYSMYYLLTALLFRTGIKCENHSASIFLLKEVFNIDSSSIYFAKKERIDKQYYVDFSITEEEVETIIRTAEEFNAELTDFIARLNSEKIKEFRGKLEKLAFERVI